MIREAVVAVTAFARTAVKAEFLTPAGVINLIGLFAIFVLIALAEVADAYQALVRTFDASYDTGSVSLVWLILAFGALLIGCVIIVGLLTTHRN